MLVSFAPRGQVHLRVELPNFKVNECKYAEYFPQAPRCPPAIGFGVGQCRPLPHCAMQIEFSEGKGWEAQSKVIL